MGISGLAPNSWLKPLEMDGTTGPDSFGSHRGPSSALNINHPQPGMKYYWGRHPRLDNGSQFQRMINQGWTPVQPSDPEHKGQEFSQKYSSIGLDNFQVHGDLVLLRTSEENYRAVCEYRSQLAKAAAQGPTEDYESKGLGLEERFGSRSDGPIYYKGSGHGVY